MTSEEYGQYIDDFELDKKIGLIPEDFDLTSYIEQRRREFESKADGGRIGFDLGGFERVQKLAKDLFGKEVKDLNDDELESIREYLSESKADGGSIGIEVLFMDKEPRTKMVSGGFLKSIGKGIGSLFGKGDDAVDLAKQEEIFRKGPITKEFLETVDSKVINPFVRTRDAKGVGSYGLYDNFDDMPAGLKAAEIIKRFVDRKTGKINYEDAEFFIGRKLKGDETINELIEIAISKPIGMGKGPFKDFEEYVLKGEKKADGGRVGLFMGGDPLTGQALQIYNSMKGYNFSDQEIADALSARGLYTPASGGGGGNEQVTGIIGSQINRDNNDRATFAPGTLQKQYEAQLKNPINNALYEMGAKFKASQPYQKTMNLGAMAMGALTGIPGLGFLLDKLGKSGNFNRGNIREMNTPKTLDATKFSDTAGINTDFGGVTVDDLGRIVQTGDYLTAENIMAGYNTGFDLTGTAFDRIDKITSRGPLSDYNRRKVKALKDFAASAAKSRKDALQKDIERAQRIKDEAARAAAVERARVKSISEGYGGHDDSPGATGPTAAGAGMGVGGGYASDYGFLKDGGLATMFTRRR